MTTAAVDGVAGDAALGQESAGDDAGREQEIRRFHELSPFHIIAGRRHSNKTEMNHVVLSRLLE